MAKLISADELYKRRGVFADDIGKHGWREAINNLPAAEPERTQDAIDRRAVIAKIEEHTRLAQEPYMLSEFERGLNWGLDTTISILLNAPSAEPERKRGEWIVYKAPDKQHCGLVECPFCGEDMIAEADEYNYCPNCGADMRGET